MKHVLEPKLKDYTLGWDEQGNPLTWNRSYSPHAMVGSDKTVPADEFVTRIAQEALDNKIETVYAIDPNRSNVSQMIGNENLKVASSVSESLQLLNDVCTEIFQRYDYCEENNINYIFYKENDFPATLMIITDDGNIFKNDEISESVRKIANLGRAVGVHLMLSVSTVDFEISGAITANAGLRIQLGTTHNQTENILALPAEDFSLKNLESHLKRDNAAVLREYSDEPKVFFTNNPISN